MNKQINNFAKIIPLDSEGNPLTTPSDYKIKEIKRVDNHKRVLYLVITLIIIAIVLGFISFYLLPLIG